MSLLDRPWTWPAGLVIAVLLVAGVIWWRRRVERGYGGYRPGHGTVSGQGSGPGTGHGTGPGGSATGEQRALLSAANQMRDALEKQARQMEELRTFWSRRLDELDRKIGDLARARAQERELAPAPQPGQGYGGYAAPYDAGMYGAESRLEAGWSPGPGDQPVEIRDGVLVVSRSLPPAGYVSAGGSGQARVYLNADVPLTEFSLPKWAAFFELQGARPYAAYRTRRPAEVRWDDGAGRGELISKGLAEAI
jgi:hypothetical protein